MLSLKGKEPPELSPDLGSLPELRAKEVEVVWGRMQGGVMGQTQDRKQQCRDSGG